MSRLAAQIESLFRATASGVPPPATNGRLWMCCALTWREQDHRAERVALLSTYFAASAAPLGADGVLLLALLGGRARAAAACSLVRNEPSSAMVLISGAGKTTVVFLSTPISTRLCKLRSCRASGWAIMVSEASPSAAAASDSPSALMILARFSRSASAWRAMATLRSDPFENGRRSWCWPARDQLR